MPWLTAVPPPALAVAVDGGRIKKRAGLPKLLHKLFIKVLRLRPAAAAAEEGPSAAFEAFYGAYYHRAMGSDEEEYCYCYSYGGAGSSWDGSLSSIPEEGDHSSDDDDEDGTPDAVAPGGPAAVLRKAKSERFVVGPHDDATVLHVEVLL